MGETLSETCVFRLPTFFLFLQIATGEEITIPYIETDQPVENRRQLLAEGYLFWCQCRRCQDESDEGNQLDI